MTELLVSIIIPVVFIIMAVTQLRKAQEVAIQKGGKAFICCRFRLIFSITFFLFFLALSYVALFTLGWGLCLVAISPAIIFFMMAVFCYCAVSDTHVYVLTSMKIGAITSVNTEKTNRGHAATFVYNGNTYRQVFDDDVYEYIKEVRQKRKSLSK